jgi:hypothetical protein
VRQAEHALRILHAVFLPAYAPMSPTGPVEGAEEKEKANAGSTKIDAFRDRVTPGEVERLYPSLIKDRVTMLPERSTPSLQQHLAQVKIIYEEDRAKGMPGVYM